MAKYGTFKYGSGQKYGTRTLAASVIGFMRQGVRAVARMRQRKDSA